MRQRPIACLALLLFLLLQIIPPDFFYESRRVTQRCDAEMTGQVSRHAVKNEKTQIYLQNCQIDSAEGRYLAGQVLVYLPDIRDYQVGTDLSLSGTIYPLEDPVNPGQFNSRLYYEGKGIFCTFYAEQAEILTVHPAPLREGLLTLRKRLEEVYEQVLGEKDGSLLKAMILGRREELDTEVKELYQRNGISHLLAISGLHLSLVGMGLYRLLRRLTGSYLAAGVPSVLFLAAYGWMTGASVSTVRAALMCGMAILADLLGRTYDMLTGIGLSALILMLANPLSARQSAFYLSYGAVLAIALLIPVWKLYRKRFRRTEAALSVSLSVLLVTFPLILCFFYEYPLYSTVLNLLVIPLMSILMVCGLLCGGIGLFSLSAAKIFAVPCHLILGVYAWTGQRCLTLPGALLSIGSPAGWKVVLYYTTLAAGLLFLYREKRREKYWRKKEPFHPGKKVLAAALGPLMLCMCLLCVRTFRGLEIRMLDVGQGDSIYVRGPDGTTFLYDGGSSDVKKVGTYRILPFLKWSGVQKLDYILVSHMDQDHINGLTELAENSKSSGGLKIGYAVLPKVPEKDEAYEKLEAAFGEAGIKMLYMEAGDRLQGRELTWTCLWPEGTVRSSDRNDLSLVLLAEYGEFQMLFTGDIGKAAEERLAASGRLCQVEILKTAHHGSRHSSAKRFLDQVQPAVSLISCSARNRYGHPGEETLQRLSDAGSRVFITKDCGALRIWTDGEKVRVAKWICR